jgi:hypothetical protein
MGVQFAPRKLAREVVLDTSHHRTQIVRDFGSEPWRALGKACAAMPETIECRVVMIGILVRGLVDSPDIMMVLRWRGWWRRWDTAHRLWCWRGIWLLLERVVPLRWWLMVVWWWMATVTHGSCRTNLPAIAHVSHLLALGIRHLSELMALVPP